MQINEIIHQIPFFFDEGGVNILVPSLDARGVRANYKAAEGDQTFAFVQSSSRIVSSVDFCNKCSF